MGFETIEHTADVGLRVWAPSLDELFTEAARALIALMGTTTAATGAHDVRLEAPDLEALMVDWLSELLYLFEGRGLVVADAEARVAPGPPSTIQAHAWTAPAESFVQSGPAVKAVTYHRIRVTHGPEGAEAEIYLDV